MPRLRPRAVLTTHDLPTTAAVVPAAGAEVTLSDEAGAAAAPTAADPGSNNFIGRLATYIPAEIIAAYQTIIAPISNEDHQNDWTHGAVGISLLVLTPVWIYFSTKNAGEKPAWHQVVNATLAFFVWLLVSGNPITAHLGVSWNPAYGSAAMGLLVLIVFPLVETATKPKS